MILMDLNSTPHVSLRHFNIKVGGFLRRRRMMMDMTGYELGQIMNLSQQQISRYERGINSVTFYQLIQFFNVLEVRWDDFLQEVATKPSFAQRHLNTRHHLKF